MNTSQNPRIEHCKFENRQCLRFVFKGVLTSQDATQAIEEWTQYFQQHPDERFILLWDSLEMTNYEPLARSMWQKTIKQFKHQIDTIWLITDKIVIKTGAMIMSHFTSFDIKVVKNEEEIPLKKMQS